MGTWLCQGTLGLSSNTPCLATLENRLPIGPNYMMLLRCCTNSPLHFSQRSFIKPGELFLYVFPIIASERSRIACLTFWCPSGNNAVNPLGLLLLKADICPKDSHRLSKLSDLTVTCTYPPMHTRVHMYMQTHRSTRTSEWWEVGGRLGNPF